MSDRSQRLTKRQQRLAEKQSRLPSYQSLNLELDPIGPITDNQVKTFQAYARGDNVFLHGSPGTGKTFISMYLALEEIGQRYSDRKRLVIVRSSLPSREIGFLPGDEKRKMETYEAPYRAICAELYGRSDAYEILKQRGIIEFHSTSFLRGTTIDEAVVLVDEVQNMSQMEWFTVLSRTGDRSRVVVCGDTKQDDLTSERYKESSGISALIRVFEAMDDASLVHFDVDDIVRSGFVKEMILTMERLGL